MAWHAVYGRGPHCGVTRTEEAHVVMLGVGDSIKTELDLSKALQGPCLLSFTFRLSIAFTSVWSTLAGDEVHGMTSIHPQQGSLLLDKRVLACIGKVVRTRYQLTTAIERRRNETSKPSSKWKQLVKKFEQRNSLRWTNYMGDRHWQGP